MVEGLDSRRSNSPVEYVLQMPQLGTQRPEFESWLEVQTWTLTNINHY